MRQTRTEERPSYLDILEDLPDEELALHGIDIEAEYERIKGIRNQITGEVVRRLTAADREMDSWGDVAVFKEQTFQAYEWDAEALWPLLTDNLHAAQIAECVSTKEIPAHVETTVHTTAVKKYASKLGEVGKQMLACAHRKPNAPRIRYERIEPLQEQLEASVKAKRAEKGLPV